MTSYRAARAAERKLRGERDFARENASMLAAEAAALREQVRALERQVKCLEEEIKPWREMQRKRRDARMEAARQLRALRFARPPEPSPKDHR